MAPQRAVEQLPPELFTALKANGMRCEKSFEYWYFDRGAMLSDVMLSALMPISPERIPLLLAQGTQWVLNSIRETQGKYFSNSMIAELVAIPVLKARLEANT